MKNNIKVYVLSSGLNKVNGYHINDWKFAKELPEEAKLFIKTAEDVGSVYTLDEFMYAFNIEEEITINDFIFITDK